MRQSCNVPKLLTYVLTLVLLSNLALLKEVAAQDADFVFSNAANFQNAKEWQLAALEWQKFLKDFPKHKDVGKAQYYLGICEMQQKKFKEAATAFAAVVKDHGKIDTIADAYVNLGWSQYQLAQAGDATKYGESAATFGELVKKFPKSEHVDDALFFRGESLYMQKKPKEAIVAYDALVKNHAKSPLRPDALYALGVTHEELKQYPEAGAVYDLFLTECAGNPLLTEVKMRKAETILQAGKYADAEKIFGEVAAVEGFTSIDHALFRQAFCVAKQEKFDAAGGLYARVVADHAKSTYVPEATISAARCFYRGSDKNNAKKWLTTAADANNEHSPEATHWLARLLLTENQGKQVAQRVKKVLPKAKDSKFYVDLLMDEADALYSTNATRKSAVEKYVAIFQQQGDHSRAPQALYNAAFGAMELKSFAEGIKLADQFLAKYTDHVLIPDVKYVSAECQLFTDDLAAAEKVYVDLAMNYSDNKSLQQWQLRLGLSLFLQKKYQETVDYLGKLASGFKATDSKAEAQYLVGVSQFYLKQYKESAAALQASMAANNKWKQADQTLLFLAQSQRQLDQTDQAIASLKKLIASYPNSEQLAQAHYRLGEYQYAQGKYSEAIPNYDKVIASWADSKYAPYSQFSKGWAELKSNKKEEAITAFTSVIDNFADHKLVPEALYARASALRQSKKFAEAKADVEKFLAISPDSPQKSDALYEKGMAEVGLKQFGSAVTTFTSLLAADKDYGSRDRVLYELGWAYKSDKKEQDATKTFAQLIKDYKTSDFAPEAFFLVGESKYQAKEFDAAITLYEKSKAQSKNEAITEHATYKLGFANFNLKKYQPALDQFSEQTDKYPKGKFFSDGLFMKAYSLFKLDQFDKALPVFDEVNKVQLRSPKMEVLALLCGGQSATRVKKWEEGLKYLEQIPVKFADSPLVPEAYYELGWAKQNTGKPTEAKADYEKAASTSRGETGARARFMIGELLFTEKKHDAAILEFKRCMFGYGGPAASAPVKNWQAKSAVEAGRCAEVQIEAAKGADRKKRITEAKSYYEFVIKNHGEHQLAPQAKTRLAALSKLR